MSSPLPPPPSLTPTAPGHPARAAATQGEVLAQAQAQDGIGSVGIGISESDLGGNVLTRPSPLHVTESSSTSTSFPANTQVPPTPSTPHDLLDASFVSTGSSTTSSLRDRSDSLRSTTATSDLSDLPPSLTEDPLADLLQPHQIFPMAALLNMAIRHFYDAFDIANTKSGIVALQAYGTWAHKLQARVHARLGMDQQERHMIERAAMHGVLPLDIAAALIPPVVLERWKLDRKREQEEALRKAAEEERERERKEREAKEKEAKERPGTSKKKALGGDAGGQEDGDEAKAKKRSADGKGKGKGKGKAAAKGNDTGGDESEDDDVPLPEYAALPGDNYFPDEPDRLPTVQLAAPSNDDEDEEDEEDEHKQGRNSGDASANLRPPGSPAARTSSRSQSPAVGPGSTHSPPNDTASPRARSSSPSGESTISGLAPPPPPAPLVLVRDDVRHAVIAHILLAATEDGRYDARARAALTKLAEWLLLPPSDVTRIEYHMATHCGIVIGSATDRCLEQDKNARAKRDRGKRLGAMAAAAVGGGLVLGLSAGLAAPLIGAGLGAVFTSVGLTGTTAFLSGTGGVALITTGATLTGSNVAQSKMARRMGGITDFAFHPVSVSNRMNVIITIGGWLAKTDEQPTDLSLPYSVLEPNEGDHFSIIWETEMLRELGNALKMIAGEVITTAVQQALMVTMLHTLLAALAWPLALLKLGYAIDNPWQNALARAKKAGQLLADLLVQQVQEGRPVTLIGYSLGARVVFYCLLELAQHKAYGIVDDVYLFGCPATPSAEQWRLARSVVAGRFVNGYVCNDWILGFLFRASSVAWTVAGLAPAKTPFIDDVDLTDLVNGHLSYRVNMPRILKHVGLRVTRDDPEFLLNRDIEAEHRIDEQARIAKEMAELERDAKKRTGKASVLEHLKEQDHKADSLSVMSRVNVEAPELLAGKSVEESSLRSSVRQSSTSSIGAGASVVSAASSSVASAERPVSTTNPASAPGPSSAAAVGPGEVEAVSGGSVLTPVVESPRSLPTTDADGQGGGASAVASPVIDVGPNPWASEGEVADPTPSLIDGTSRAPLSPPPQAHRRW